MPRIIELDDDGGLLAQIFRQQRKREIPRTGLHLSTVVDDLVACAYPKRQSELPDAVMLSLQELGNVVEDVLGTGLRLRAGWDKPAPRILDGITCSPDGANPYTKTIDECKACWAQWTNRDEFFDTPRGYNYLMRIGGYCHVWGWDRARLSVLFIRGVKGGAPLAKPKTFLLRYPLAERREKWRIITQHAKDRGLYARVVDHRAT